MDLTVDLTIKFLILAVAPWIWNALFLNKNDSLAKNKVILSSPYFSSLLGLTFFITMNNEQLDDFSSRASIISIVFILISLIVYFIALYFVWKISVKQTDFKSYYNELKQLQKAIENDPQSENISKKIKEINSNFCYFNWAACFLSISLISFFCTLGYTFSVASVKNNYVISTGKVMDYKEQKIQGAKVNFFANDTINPIGYYHTNKMGEFQIRISTTIAEKVRNVQIVTNTGETINSTIELNQKIDTMNFIINRK